MATLNDPQKTRDEAPERPSLFDRLKERFCYTRTYGAGPQEVGDIIDLDDLRFPGKTPEDSPLTKNE